MKESKEMQPQIKKKNINWRKAFRVWVLVVSVVVLGITPFAVTAKGNSAGFSATGSNAKEAWAKQDVSGQLLTLQVTDDGSSIVNRYEEGLQDEAVVPKIQTRLMELGYMGQEEPTDEYNGMVASAVRMFERKHGIEPDGIMTDYEYNLLMSDAAKEYSVSIGYEGVDVEELQKRLQALGYLKTVTGEYGIFTESAVKEFQKSNGLEETGAIDRNTREMLYDPAAVAKAITYGEESEEIKTYQQRLKELGYYYGSVDGVFSSATVAAVKRFQNKNGLIADGSIGPETADKIVSENAEAFAYSITDNDDGVRDIQERLSALGYMSNVTGYYGEHTETAVKKFQEINGLKVTGKVNSATYQALSSNNAKKYAEQTTPAPTPSQNTGTQTPAQPSASNSPAPSSSGSSSPAPSESASTPKPSPSKPSGTPATGSANSSKVEEFIAVAESMLGKPYVLGGKGPEEYDCSGFVYWCLQQVGVSQGYMTSSGWMSTTKYPIVTSISELQRGDVISYQGHVGIYLGGNKMIDASSTEGKIRVTSIGGSYWQTNFHKGCRIF
ncbi:MAG: peptidoglycan-binding protein [Christensenellaceae bacterium]|jgi:peptidoglycan hydrolase-like protein with peptidoglycan-binding domain